MNTSNILPVVNSTRGFIRTVIRTQIEALSNDSVERCLLEGFAQSLEGQCRELEGGALLASISDNAEREWLSGKSSADIAKEYCVPEALVDLAIDERTECVRTIQEKLKGMSM